ncbi:hypothetical protein [Phocicoccus pinnipedialis]|uniref:Uncharacterized protein n=1 Tax=Phocicoccus pinnipedialis TaxID=110845 RepID=A0A6V7RIW8_9BACL|nr:hypothetical protein [Jeotgalicoccus pinnipedialis]MBP1939006.1 hypothetical protein [Jeotgalicoccus pinnipedialis]CAD2077210.1 hypothetical protein JEOPIN946_01432 [Jeotgalicoccus pinnipedialis]
MKIKNEKLKVYEFLYNRVSFSEEELEEYAHLKRMNVLESMFNSYLKKIDPSNIEIFWHLTLPIEKRKETIEVMIVTSTTVHLFKILDLSGLHTINPFNILLKKDLPILDLNLGTLYYNVIKDTKIEQDGFSKPIFLNYVVLDETFSLIGQSNYPFLTPRTLTAYLKKIEETSKSKKHNALF